MHALLPHRAMLRRTARLCRGVHSALTSLAFPFGKRWLGGTGRLSDADRLSSGLVIVLPGIEGSSSLTWNLAQGINDAGVPAAIVIHDWTTGFWPFCLYHLRAQRRNRRQARAVAKVIAAYQDTYPGRPVYLVGHSGGGALAAWILEELAEQRTIAAAVLLGPALAPTYPLATALRRTEQGIWHFFSPLDLLFLAAGTALFGTLDGRHTFSAGQCGFRLPVDHDAEEADLYHTHLHQHCYSFAALWQFHAGGHFGWANRVFVAETLGPLFQDRLRRGKSGVGVPPSGAEALTA